MVANVIRSRKFLLISKGREQRVRKSTMKLRIKGNSLRLRALRSEAARLIQTGRLQETIQFAREDSAKLSYALEFSAGVMEMTLRYRPQEVTVRLPTLEARRWFESDEVGVVSRR